MSRPVNKAPVDTPRDRQYKQTEQEAKELARLLDERLKSLSERILPAQPYLLSVPSTYPYRYSSRFFNSWYVGTPFAPDEEQLQYLSFLPHQDDNEDLLNVVGGWADEKGNRIEEEASMTPRLPSAPNTPVQNPSRKKISLKDYKTKDKTNQNTPNPNNPSKEVTKHAMRNESRDDVVKVSEGIKVTKEVPSAAKEKARPLDPKDKEPNISRSATVSRSENLPSPRKRRKLSDDHASDKKHTQSKGEVDEPIRKSKPLPTLLSPTLPASDDAGLSKVLPDLLSPALPPTLERAVAKADADSHVDAQPIKRSDHVKSILENALGSSAEKRLPASASKESVRDRSDSQVSSKTPATTTKTSSPVVKPVKIESRPSTPLQNGVRPSTGPRQRRLIVLKYGKKNRKNVESLLRFASRPKKVKPIPGETLRRPPEPDSGPTTAAIDTSRVVKKRPADPSPERPVKKQKPSSLLDTPEKLKTPNAMAAKSPVPPSSTNRTRVEIATPKRELKPSAMQRIASSEGMDVKTPPISTDTTSTPLRNTSTSHMKSSPAAASSSAARDSDRAAWQELNQKYFAIGRTLKREGTALSEKKNEHDQALSVVLSIEAILCFMINLAAQSHARPSVDPGWHSMLPYQIQVFRSSRKYRHLHGLVIQLGAICRQIWHNHNIDRLARDPLPDEYCGSAPTPGSDGNTKTDDSEKYKQKYIKFRDDLVLNSRELQSARLEGSRHLSPYLIERDYPKTWVRRCKDTSRRGLDKLNPNAISKDFYLPLDASSSAFEAMQFSLAFLEEWTAKEKVTWKARIEL